MPGEPDALEWPIDFDWVTQDQTAWIDLETNLLLDGKSPLTALHQPASIQVHIDQVRAWVRGKREEAITEDVALDTLWLAASRESLFPLPLQLHFRVENEDWSKKVGAERVSGLTEKGYLYRLSTPLLLPQHLRPGRLWVRPEGQDQDAGSLGLPFSMLRCRWKMVLGSNNSAETPRICPEHLELEEKKRARPLEPDGKSPPWTPTEDGQARLRSGEKLPIVDDMFLPILPCPRDGLLGPLAGATPPMAITLWVPGLPPNSRPLHPTGALFANQGEILSIRNLLHTQQAIRFTAAGGSRGLLYPKEYSEGIGSSYHEIQPTRGIFLLPDDADRRYLLWFRGLYLPCTLETLGKAQRFLRLAAPLPCDGRLGEDVGPFLPLRARMYSEDGKKRLLLRQGPLHERLWSSGGSNWSGGSLSFEWADHGFAPKPPESPTGRYAWRNHVWRERGGAIDFEGWVIPVQGGYTSPGSGSFSSWGIRIASQPQSRTITIFDSEFEQLPAFPEPVQAVLREILEQDAHSGGYELDSPEGKITISPVFSSPLDPKPSRIRIEFPAGSGLPDVRLFFAEGR